jgi:hypothetical protein
VPTTASTANRAIIAAGDDRELTGEILTRPRVANYEPEQNMPT